MPTVILLTISHVLGSRWGLLILGVLAGAVVMARRAVRSPRFRITADRVKLRVPLAGRVVLGYAVSRFCRVLGTLLHNGVPLLRALDISSHSAGNAVLGQAIRQSAEHVSSGSKLSVPLAHCGLVPRPVMAMIRVAEESNNLDEVLVHVADAIDRQNARLLDVLVRLVEPILLLIMGAMIMFVITAMLLPVIDLGAAMGH
jgi:general secretion pathway protein F/type IV pilus assembly protein PilC